MKCKQQDQLIISKTASLSTIHQGLSLAMRFSNLKLAAESFLLYHGALAGATDAQYQLIIQWEGKIRRKKQDGNLTKLPRFTDKEGKIQDGGSLLFNEAVACRGVQGGSAWAG